MAVVRAMDAVALAVVLLHITQSELGVVSLAMAVAQVVEAVATHAFHLTAAIVQAEEMPEKRKHSCMWYALGVGAAATLAMAASAPLLGWFFESRDLAVYVLVLCPRAIVLPLWAVITAFLNRELRFSVIAQIRTSSSFVAASVRIAVALGVGGAWAMVVSHVAQGVFVMIAAFWLSGYRMKLEFDWKSIRPLASFGVPLTFAHLARTLLHNVDYFLIGKILGERALGIYRVAFELAVELAVPLVQIAHRATRPVLARLKESRTEYNRTFLWFIRSVMLAFAPFCAVVFWGAEDILTLMARGQMSSALDALPLTQALVVVCFGRVAFELLPIAFITSDRPKEVLRFDLASLTVLTVAMWSALSLFPERGVIVAAWVWLALYPVLFVAMTLRADSQLGLPAKEVFKSIGGSLVGIAATFGLGATVSAGLAGRLSPVPRLIVLLVAVLGAAAGIYFARHRRVGRAVA